MQKLSKFCERLTEERKRLSLTQAQFAKACGVKPASQFLYEKGDRSPNSEYLLKAQGIGVRIDYLFAGEAALSTQTTNVHELGRLFKRVDDLSRDALGRLTDLESRVQLFMLLLEEGESSTNQAHKLKTTNER